MPSRFPSSLTLEHSASHSSGAFIPLSAPLCLTDSRSSACSLICTWTPQDRPEKEPVRVRWQLGQPRCKSAPESCPSRFDGLFDKLGGLVPSFSPAREVGVYPVFTGQLGSLEWDRGREVFPSRFRDSQITMEPRLCISSTVLPGSPFWGKSPGLTPHIRGVTIAKPSFGFAPLEPRAQRGRDEDNKST